MTTLNQTFVIKEIKQEKEKPWNIINVMMAPKKMCKSCTIKSRREGSSYCQDCSDKFKNG
jgi:hypothetical protein